jgi:plastocyanin
VIAAVPPPAPAPARVQVVAKEFSFALSRLVVKRGAALIEAVNYGEDAHDLRLRREGSSQTAVTPVVQAGGRATLETTLAPGHYLLYCSLSDHRARGMRAVLTVRR